MGSVLGGVFGGGQQQESKTEVDPITQEMNRMRRDQLSQLFGAAPVSSFAKESKNAGLYDLDKQTQQLIDWFSSDRNIMSLDQYMKAGLDEGSNYISQVATPEILSTANLQGLEGSGMVPEAIAKATAGIALPFLQGIPGFTSAQAQQAQGLVGMSDLPRQLKVEDLLRRQGVVTSGLTGIPFAPSSETKGGTASLPLFNLFGMGGKL